MSSGKIILPGHEIWPLLDGSAGNHFEQHFCIEFAAVRS
jgi:hypothetical protein